MFRSNKTYGAVHMSNLYSDYKQAKETINRNQ